MQIMFRLVFKCLNCELHNIADLSSKYQLENIFKYSWASFWNIETYQSDPIEIAC